MEKLWNGMLSVDIAVCPLCDYLESLYPNLLAATPFDGINVSAFEF